MKILRYLTMAVLVLGLSGVARAFTFQVLDPPTSQGSAPNITPGVSVTFGFYDCPSFILTAENIPAGEAAGCFDAVNYSSDLLTSFSATVDSTDPLPSGVQCPTSTPMGSTYPNAFSNVITCTSSGNEMDIVLSGSPGIPPGHTLWIVETGVDPSEFSATAGSFTVGAVPEPSSIWMALTGTGALGYVLRRRRRIFSA